MSWNFYINATAKAEFDAAVDAAVPMGQPLDSIGLAEDVAVAKAALKTMGARVKRAKLSGSAGGHCLQPDETANMSDSINVSVYGMAE